MKVFLLTFKETTSSIEPLKYSKDKVRQDGWGNESQEKKGSVDVEGGPDVPGLFHQHWFQGRSVVVPQYEFGPVDCFLNWTPTPVLKYLRPDQHVLTVPENKKLKKYLTNLALQIVVDMVLEMRVGVSYDSDSQFSTGFFKIPVSCFMF
jgi:hypothetical protein